MRDPIVCDDGHSYERCNIVRRWARASGDAKNSLRSDSLLPRRPPPSPLTPRAISPPPFLPPLEERSMDGNRVYFGAISFVSRASHLLALPFRHHWHHLRRSRRCHHKERSTHGGGIPSNVAFATSSSSDVCPTNDPSQG